MRFDQQPANSCLSGSGLPMPPNGSSRVSWISRMRRSAFLRSCSTHQARSSRAAASNSKLRTGFLDGETTLSVFGFQEALLHRFASQQVSRLPFGFDLMPQCDRHNDADRFALGIGNVLDAFCQARHADLPSSVSLTPGWLTSPQDFAKRML